MTDAARVLTRADVRDGVADMIPRVQVEAVFTDGSRLVTIHSPISARSGVWCIGCSWALMPALFALG